MIAVAHAAAVAYRPPTTVTELAEQAAAGLASLAMAVFMWGMIGCLLIFWGKKALRALADSLSNAQYGRAPAPPAYGSHQGSRSPQTRPGAHRAATAARVTKYSSKSPLNDAGLPFLRILEKALPEYYVFPQVGLSAFLDPYTHQSNAKRVDFLLCGRRRGDPLLVIQLEDSSRDRRVVLDGQREAMLKSAGIPTILYLWRDAPTEAEIRADVRAHLENP